jgi:hypothetical protein
VASNATPEATVAPTVPVEAPAVEVPVAEDIQEEPYVFKTGQRAGRSLDTESDANLTKILKLLKNTVKGISSGSVFDNTTADINAIEQYLSEEVVTPTKVKTETKAENDAEIAKQVAAFNASQVTNVPYSVQGELFGEAEIDLDHVATTIDGGVPNQAAPVLDAAGNQVDLQGKNTLAEYFDAKPEKKAPKPAAVSEEVDFNNLLDEALDQINSVEEVIEEAVTPDIIEGSYLKKIRNFFGTLPENLASLNLSETEVTVLNELARLNKKLSGNLSAVVEALKDPSKPFTVNSKYAVNDTKDTLMQNPMLMLAKAITVGSKAKRAYFDPNIVSMINLAGINWIATQGTGTMFNSSDAIRRVLRAESNVAKTDNSAIQKVRFAGTMYTTLVESLGKEIYKQLSIHKQQSNVDGLHLKV